MLLRYKDFNVNSYNWEEHIFDCNLFTNDLIGINNTLIKDFKPYLNSKYLIYKFQSNLTYQPIFELNIRKIKIHKLLNV